MKFKSENDQDFDIIVDTIPGGYNPFVKDLLDSVEIKNRSKVIYAMRYIYLLGKECGENQMALRFDPEWDDF
jgi:hypothetical protein